MTNGQHCYYAEIKDVKYENKYTSDKCSYQYVFGPFDDAEMKEINGILKKGHSIAACSLFDYNGEVVWKNNFGGNKSGSFNDIVVVSDGYIVCGKDGANYGLIVKFDYFYYF